MACETLRFFIFIDVLTLFPAALAADWKNSGVVIYSKSKALSLHYANFSARALSQESHFHWTEYRESYSVSFYLIESSDKNPLYRFPLRRDSSSEPPSTILRYGRRKSSPFDGFVKFLYVVGKSKTQG